MGLQNTTNTTTAICEMHDDRLMHARYACDQSDAFFVTILQGWAYKTQPTQQQHATCDTHDDRLAFRL